MRTELPWSVMLVNTLAIWEFSLQAFSVQVDASMKEKLYQV